VWFTGAVMKHSWVEVNLGVLEENIRNVRTALRRSEIMFVVKANAYGHGLVPVANRAAAVGVKWFAVAYLQEAIPLRQALPDADILILGVVAPADVAVLMEKRIAPIVVSEQQGCELGSAAKALGRRLPVHLKIDTGMGRLGILWDDADRVIERLSREPGLDIQGMCTHFATVKPSNLASAKAQAERFAGACAAGERCVGRKLFKHASSSRAFLYVHGWDFDAVRPGIALYGYGANNASVRVRTCPILQWKTNVVQVKRLPASFPVGYYGAYVTPVATCVATLCVGYADGYPRLLGNKGHVLIRGRRRPVVGRISMNWVTVDVGPDTDVREGDEVVLMGEQGGEKIWADELAALCQTIPYEILTDINPMLDRKYTG
jgi:alanine racemase